MCVCVSLSLHHKLCHKLGSTTTNFAGKKRVQRAPSASRYDGGVSLPRHTETHAVTGREAAHTRAQGVYDKACMPRRTRRACNAAWRQNVWGLGPQDRKARRRRFLRARSGAAMPQWNTRKRMRSPLAIATRSSLRHPSRLWSCGAHRRNLGEEGVNRGVDIGGLAKEECRSAVLLRAADHCWQRRQSEVFELLRHVRML